MNIPEVKIISIDDIEIWDQNTLLFKGNKEEADKKLIEIIETNYKGNITQFKQDLLTTIKNKYKLK